MINEELIYNLDYITIVPNNSDYLELIKYSIKNVITFSKESDIQRIMNFTLVNSVKKIIFVDYLTEYDEIIKNIDKNILIDFVFTHKVSSFSDYNIINMYNSIVSLLNTKKINKLAFLDKALYEKFSKNYNNIYYLKLDIEKTNKQLKQKNYIGILNSDKDPKHSFYNELSAVKMIEKYKVKLNNITEETGNFLKIFNIKNKKVSKDKLYINNIINLDINFSSISPYNFLKSMDNNIPCIIGNNDLNLSFELKDYLMIKSDDDITEIKGKIGNAIKDKNKILKLYKEFRENYSKESKKLVKDFLGKDLTEENSDLLLSVIMPVYNVENYLEASLKSVIESKIDNMEIIIINDGSKDNSEEIIEKYLKKYPNLIRYIKQENHGIGYTRNIGIKNAKGKYISFIDSDDIIDKNYYKESLPYLNDDIDVVLCNWLTIYSKENTSETYASDRILKINNNYKKILYSTIMASPCNKIVKKSLYNNIDLKFVEGHKYEDLGTIPIIMLNASKIKYIDKPYYHYIIRKGSIMRTSIGFDMIDIIKILDERIDKYVNFSKEDLEEFRYYTYLFRIEESIINEIYKMDINERNKYVDYMYQNILEILNKLFNSKIYIEFLNKLDDKRKEFLLKRNKAILDRTFSEFIDNNEMIEFKAIRILYDRDNW